MRTHSTWTCAPVRHPARMKPVAADRAGTAERLTTSAHWQLPSSITPDGTRIVGHGQSDLMLAGTMGDDTGQRSIVAAKRLWPRQDLRRTPRSRKDDGGFSDALLIAELARRYRLGGDVFAATERGA